MIEAFRDYGDGTLLDILSKEINKTPVSQEEALNALRTILAINTELVARLYTYINEAEEEDAGKTD